MVIVGMLYVDLTLTHISREVYLFILVYSGWLGCRVRKILYAFELEVASGKLWVLNTMCKD